MKIYQGMRGPGIVGKASVMVVSGPGPRGIQPLSPKPSQDLTNHSPDGFQWGYRGSGPAQLALALLLDVTGNEEESKLYYQDFKDDFVSGWGDVWEISDNEIKNWLERIKIEYGKVSRERLNSEERG